MIECNEAMIFFLSNRRKDRQRNRRPASRRFAGFILVEALLAVAILSVSLTLIIQSFSSSLRTIILSSDYFTAAMLAENKMADLIYARLINGAGEDEGHFSGSREEFRYRTETHPLEENLWKNLDKIDLTVSWASGRKEKNISWVTYFYNSVDEE